jgi:hypothetical protein
LRNENCELQSAKPVPGCLAENLMCLGPQPLVSKSARDIGTLLAHGTSDQRRKHSPAAGGLGVGTRPSSHGRLSVSLADSHRALSGPASHCFSWAHNHGFRRTISSLSRQLVACQCLPWLPNLVKSSVYLMEVGWGTFGFFHRPSSGLPCLELV